MPPHRVLPIPQIQKLGVAFEFAQISPASPAPAKRDADSAPSAASLTLEEVQRVRLLRALQMEVARRFGSAATTESDTSPCSPSGA